MKESWQIRVRIYLLQALLYLWVCWEQQKYLPHPAGHDLGLGVQHLLPLLVLGGDLGEAGHEAEELSKVSRLQEEEHRDLITTRERGEITTVVTETTH